MPLVYLILFLSQSILENLNIAFAHVHHTRIWKRFKFISSPLYRHFYSWYSYIAVHRMRQIGHIRPTTFFFTTSLICALQSFNEIMYEVLFRIIWKRFKRRSETPAFVHPFYTSVLFRAFELLGISNYVIIQVLVIPAQSTSGNEALPDAPALSGQSAQTEISR